MKYIKILNKLEEFGKKYDNYSLLDMVKQAQEFPHETSYDDIVDFFQINILGFCGCGRPYNNIKFVADSLKLVKKYKQFGNSFGETREQTIERLEQYKKEQREFFGNDQIAEFMLYWLDAKGFTEHGGSVGSSWINEKGYDFLDLFEMLEDLTDED
jgi:hypothetical protein